MIPFSYIISGITFLFLSFLFNLSNWEAGACSIFVFALFNFLKRLAVKFVFLDIIILIASIQWLLAPAIAYNVFNKSNPLAKLWDTYMKVPSDEYYSYVLPGTLLFIVGLNFPLSLKPVPSAQAYINKTKVYLFDKSYICISLVGIGFAFTLIDSFAPQVIRGITSYFSFLTFIGVFYALFSSFKFKKTVVLSVLSLLIIQCILTGMYGALIYWSLLIAILFFIGTPFPYWKKIVFCTIGIFCIFLIQSIKAEYREKTWDTGMVRNSNVSFFGELLGERITNPSTIFEPKRLFGMALRSNQGALIAKTMNYVPKYEPFANGETIFMAVVSAFVPRVFWPDKPMSGGKAMIVRFLGAPDNLEYSYNLSPIGEAYVNFGRLGGILFMLLYGLFYNYIFLLILKWSIKTPTLVLWLPVFFIGPISSMETDVLAGVNSLVKAFLFAWIVYKCYRVFFKINL